MSTTTTAIFLASAAVVFSPQTISAGEVRPATQRLTYADLDLATPLGADAARSRARASVEHLCFKAVTPDDGSYDHKIPAMRCRKRARVAVNRTMAALIAAAPERKRMILNGSVGAELAVAVN